jgi:hypothetical protein
MQGREEPFKMGVKQAKVVGINLIKRVQINLVYDAQVEAIFECAGQLPDEWWLTIKNIFLVMKWDVGIKYSIVRQKEQKREKIYEVMLDLAPSSWFSNLLFCLFVRKKEKGNNIVALDFETIDHDVIRFKNSAYFLEIN